jgi:hypothetical protein
MVHVISAGGKMKSQLGVMIVIVSCLLAAVVGYSISSSTGVEPGYFEAPDAGGYGASAEAGAPEGISSDLQDYYNSLTEE